MKKHLLFFLLFAVTCTWAWDADARDITDWLSLDVYLRGRGSVQTRGDSGSLSNTTKLGRLMNESSKIQVDLEATPFEDVIGHVRMEGETLRGADSIGGSLSQMSLTQTYVEARDVLTDGLSVRVGSADYLMGVMQYYDTKPGRVLLETYGIRVDYRMGEASFTAAFGDSGFIRRKGNYTTLPTGALAVSWKPDSLRFMAAAELYGEAEELSGEAVSSGSLGYKAALGLQYAADSEGDSVRRVDAYASVEHPLPTKDGNLPRDMYSVTVGYEMEIGSSDALRVGLGVLSSWSYSDDARTNLLEVSPLIRAEYSATRQLHVLAESVYYVHADLDAGDKTHAWQGKAGVVWSPNGPGLLVRPHLRLLYGAMYVSNHEAQLGQADDRNWKHAVSAEFELKF